MAINSGTLLSAKEEGQNLIKEVCECKWPVVLLSAESLISKDIDQIIRDPFFRLNLTLFGVDKVHVLCPWGKDFRQAYRQIALLRRRLPEHTAFFAGTGTLSLQEAQELYNELGLKEGRFKSIRLSCERLYVRLIFRELTHSLGGFQFPDIVWVFKCGVKVILYCKTIDLCLRVALYGWSLHPVIRALDNVRLWTSLTSQEYNACMLSLFEDNADTSVIVATIAFGMGMNIRNVTDSVNLGLPDTLATLHQQNGRASRNFSIEARGWTYIESSILAAVRDELETGKVTKSASKTKKAHKQPLSTVPLPAQDIAEPVVATLSKGKVKLEDLEDSLRLCLVAFVASECLYATINPLLGNSDPKSKLWCREARRLLPCSNCDLLWLDLYPYLACTTPTPSTLLPTPALTPVTASTPSASTTPGLDTPAPKPYPKYVQENAALWLNDLAQR